MVGRCAGVQLSISEALFFFFFSSFPFVSGCDKRCKSSSIKRNGRVRRVGAGVRTLIAPRICVVFTKRSTRRNIASDAGLIDYSFLFEREEGSVGPAHHIMGGVIGNPVTRGWILAWSQKNIMAVRIR